MPTGLEVMFTLAVGLSVGISSGVMCGQQGMAGKQQVLLWPAGGGVALLYASKSLDAVKEKLDNFDQTVGVQILQTALRIPLKTIADNAGRLPMLLRFNLLPLPISAAFPFIANNALVPALYFLPLLVTAAFPSVAGRLTIALDWFFVIADLACIFIRALSWLGTMLHLFMATYDNPSNTSAACERMQPTWAA